MPAYLLVDIVRVRDETIYAAYRGAVSPTLAAAGGCYLIRGGDPEALAGDWTPDRLVFVRFDTLSNAQAWWSSPSYSALKADRQQSTESNMIAVEGVGGSPGAPMGELRAFVILDVRSIEDEAGFADFRDRAEIILAARRGTCLVSGGAVQVLEGAWEPGRLFVLGFPTEADARAWWASPDQAELIQHLRASTTTNVLLVHGLNEGRSS